MIRHESSSRCPKCGCANGHRCSYERCAACGRRGRTFIVRYTEGEPVTAYLRASLSEALVLAA